MNRAFELMKLASEQMNEFLSFFMNVIFPQIKTLREKK